MDATKFESHTIISYRDIAVDLLKTALLTRIDCCHANTTQASWTKLYNIHIP